MICDNALDAIIDAGALIIIMAGKFSFIGVIQTSYVAITFTDG